MFTSRQSAWTAAIETCNASQRTSLAFGIAAVVAISLLLPGAAFADWEPTTQFGDHVFSSEPAGVAVNRSTGEVYVGEVPSSGGSGPKSARVDRFDSQGRFLGAWGAGVVTGGAEGSGDVSGGSTEVVNVATTHKAFEVGQTVIGGEIPAGTTIVAVGAGTLTLSQAATGTTSGDQLTVAEGAGNVPTNEIETISVTNAALGAFELGFTTPNPSPTSAKSASIAAGASAAQIQSALEAMSNIGAGNVAVTGSAGGPWTVEFKGARFADTDVNQLTIANEESAYKVGAQLSCTSSTAATTTNYQWLRNGSPIAGAKSAAYTTEAADSGKAIQCQVFKLNANAGATQIASPARLVGSVPATLPPKVPAAPIAAPTLVSGTLTVGGAGGAVLRCAPGAWTGAESFEYQWYRNGVALSGNGAGTQEYTVQAADLTTAAVFQCEIVATNAGGSTAKLSSNKATSTAPSPAAPGGTSSPQVSVVGPVLPQIATTLPGASAAEVCMVPTDCESGLAIAGDSQFERPAGVAVDQKTGDVYVMDTSQNRVTKLIQEFTATGGYLSSFGERGSSSPEQLQLPSGNEPIGSYDYNGLAVGPTGKIYVVDQGEAFGPRVVIFKPSGEYEGSVGTGLFDSALVLAPESVAVDDFGNIYVATGNSTQKFDASGNEVWYHADVNSQTGGLAVNEESEEPFYFTRRLAETYVVRLNSSGEQVEEIPSFAGEEVTDALAVNPDVVLSGPARPNGTLYGVNALTHVGMIFEQAPVVAPVIATESVSDIGETAATLKASVNPHNGSTTYQFEYGTTGPCDANPCSRAPATPGLLGSGNSARTAAATIAGLAAGTTYHYRVIATNQGGVSDGEDHTFSTYPVGPAGLPDARAYEMVSPLAKDDGEVVPPELRGGSCEGCVPGVTAIRVAPMGVASNGQAVLYEGEQFSPELHANADEYIATRTSRGWSTVGITPPSFEEDAFEMFSSDLNHGILCCTQIPDATNSDRFENAYLWSKSGSVESLIAQTQEKATFIPEIFAGANVGTETVSPLSHVLFSGHNRLTAEDPGVAPAAPDPGPAQKDHDLYEWFEGQLRLVNVLPGNAAAATGAGVEFGSGQNNGFGTDISADGSHVFWSDASGQVYVRLDGRETVEIEDPGRFVTASSDGSRVLLDDGCVYLLSDHSCRDLTAGQGGFQGMLGASEDLSRVYFVDTAALTPSGDENENGEHAQSGEDNLYYWHEGAVGFIGTLLAEDGAAGAQGGVLPPATTWHYPRKAQVTADGRYLTFTSTASLTGYDNRLAGLGRCSVNAVPSIEPRCFEVFEYQAESGRLSCASCNPTGQRPLGGATLPTADEGAFSTPRDLTASGAVFFESLDRLSSRDVNGDVQDVYEWEPQRGSGQPSSDTCELAGGCVYLISSGHSPSDSFFMDATASGSDAFLITRSRLVGADTDELYDLYDARVGGGFSEEASVSPCAGEACKGAAAASSSLPAVTSSSFVGSGNAKQAASKPVAKKHVKTRKSKKKKKKKRARRRVRAGATRGRPSVAKHSVSVRRRGGSK